LKEIDHLWAEIDLDGSGSIEFSEYAVAAANKEALLTDKRLRQAFAMFDADWSGQISSEELQKVMEPLVKTKASKADWR
jgi:calcium-dependent protein kinase